MLYIQLFFRSLNRSDTPNTHNTCSEPAVEGPKMGHQSVTVRNNEMVYFENLATIMTKKRGYLLQTTLVMTD